MPFNVFFYIYVLSSYPFGGTVAILHCRWKLQTFLSPQLLDSLLFITWYFDICSSIADLHGHMLAVCAHKTFLSMWLYKHYFGGQAETCVLALLVNTPV